MARSIITGIDIGTSSIRVAVCEYKDGSLDPVILALVKKNSRGLRRGYIIDIDETIESLREAIAEAERLAKVKIKRALVAIGGVTLESKISEGSVVVSRADLEINHNDIKRAIEDSEQNLSDIANRNILHRIPLMYKIDGKKVLGKPEEMKGNKLEVKTLFITCAKQHLKDLIRSVEEVGVIVEDVVASPLAASGVTMSKIQKTSGCVLSNIGSQTTSIVVFEEGIPISLQVFPVGSTDITNDIALGFKIPLEEAEKIKKRESDPMGPKRKLDDIIEARISDVFEYIEMHLKKIGRNGLLPAGIIITGGGSNIVNIEDLARSYFKLPARLASPTKLTEAGNQTVDSSWSVAFGLCVYDYSYEQTDRGGVHSSGQFKKTFLKWLKEFIP